MSSIRPARRSLLAGSLGLMATGALASPALALPGPRPAQPAGTTPATASTPSSRLTLYPPTGPGKAGAIDLHLIDSSRPDPWSDSGRPRELMVTISYPARSTRHSPRRQWLPDLSADLLFAQYGVPDGASTAPLTFSAEGAPAQRERRPVLLFSPGAASSRAFHTMTVEDLVSWGYIVVSIDHPVDALMVEFPDGRMVVRGVPPETDDYEIAHKEVEVRTADARFVLDSLARLNRGENPDASGRPIPDGLAGALDLSRVGAFGHSLGGATTTSLLLLEDRVRVGVNIDGAIFGPARRAGLDRPLLLLEQPHHDGLEKDSTWVEMWPRLRGWRRCLRLADADHNSFADFVSLVRQLDLPAEDGLQLGEIRPDRAIAATRAVIRAFFDVHLRGRPDRAHLLWGAAPRYPEIGFIA